MLKIHFVEECTLLSILIVAWSSSYLQIEIWSSNEEVQSDATALEDRLNSFWSVRQDSASLEHKIETKFVRLTVSVYDYSIEDDIVGIS